MRVDYHQRLVPVIRYLEQHFNEPHNLPEVAALANLSPYHFHRTFKAVQGETLADFIRRLRLEAAADDLFKSKQAVLNIALEYGFSSSQSLAKAFKQHYGVTPTAFRDCENYQQFSELARNSKIGHTLRKNGNEVTPSDSYTGSQLTKWSTTMETQNFEKAKLAYIRVNGPYGQGYEERGRSETDERVRVLNLTEQGRALKEQAKSVPNAMMCKITLELDEMIMLKKLCGKVLDNLS